MAPLEAPQVPIVYQLLKSVGPQHPWRLTQVVGPYLDNPADQSWRGPMLAFRSRMQSALDAWMRRRCKRIGAATSAPSCRTTSRSWTTAWQRAPSPLRHWRHSSKKQSPYLKKIVAWAGADPGRPLDDGGRGLKKMLGADWDKTYAASNTIYVARQNNILFSVLAQFFGPEAINDRLMLIETISFTTTPDDMLESLVRIIGDRSVGSLFFGNYRLMDYELMGGDARAAIVAESEKRG